MDELMEATSQPAMKAGGRKEIESIRVEPAKNGGHTVRHSYRSRRVYRKGANGGMTTEYVDPEEYVFGPDDGHKMLTHIAKYLGMTKIAREEGSEDREGGEK